MTGTEIVTSSVPAAAFTFLGLSVGTLVVLGLILVLALWLVSAYNGLVALRNNRERSFADVDVQLKLRFDLVPNLVETVKGYAKHESGTLEAVIAARTKYMGAQTADEKIESSNMLTGALKSIFALSEAYPDLKANVAFGNLQSELSDIENKVAAARRFFNAATTEYNTARDVFPTVLVANSFGFARAPLFDVGDRAVVEVAPKVSF